MLTTASNPLPDPKTILVVDDDLSVLGVIKCMLECGDYNVLMAHSAETALRMAEREDRAARKKCNCKSWDKSVQT